MIDQRTTTSHHITTLLLLSYLGYRKVKLEENNFFLSTFFIVIKYLTPILGMIGRAQKYVYISVMDYYAALIYHKPRPKYWDKIDRALRAAVFDRGVTVHMLTSKWNSTRQQVEFVSHCFEGPISLTR